MKELLRVLQDSLVRKEPVELVTIIESSGSVPREAGARMAVNAHGRIYGTTGGGIAEHLAEEYAKSLLSQKQSGFKEYILHPNEEADLGAKCGGIIRVYFQYLDPEDDRLLPVIETGLGCFTSPDAAWLVIELDAPGFGVLGDTKIIGWCGEALPDPAPFRQSKGTRIQQSGRHWFSEPLLSRGFVYVFGSGHVSQELVPVLAHLGFRCAVFDDRSEFKERFPAAEAFVTGDYNAIGRSITITAHDYAVIMTKGHVFDYQAEVYALGTPARYIGIIGSRTKLEFMEGRLKAAGCTDAELHADRIHAPIGVPCNSKTPAEIAVSVAAELIRVRAEEKMESEAGNREFEIKT
ncbi:hypothetical protein FACS1894172_17280 [Spirochaetia bacterium]|nr:hypothetical protein FACS1894164_16550 [Spirochaetia bacterium]GHU35437.1 hypothetical protein FACS1894172_17280 [Spirochaetia bacterium]